MKKPSKIFEGENSSLRKTFDNATMADQKQPQLRERAREMFERDFEYPRWWNINGGWEEDANGLHFCRFIDQIITLAQEEKIKSLQQFDEYQFLRGLGINDGDSMNAEEIGDVCEQLKQRFIKILKQ